MSKQKILFEFSTIGDKRVVKAFKTINSAMKKGGYSNDLLSSKTKKTSTALREQTRVIKMLTNAMNVGLVAQKKAEKQQKKNEKATEKTNQATRRMRGIVLGAGLSLMFMGMAMQRLGSSALRGLFGVFNNFEEGTTKMQTSLTGMRASFEFLKFAIVNALEGTIIERFVILITEAFVKLADFFSGNPAFAVAITLLFTTLFAVGTAAALFGQIWLFVAAFKALFAADGDFVKGIDFTATKDAFKKGFGKLGVWGDVIKIAVGLSLIWDATVDIKKMFKDETTTMFEHLKNIGQWTIGGALIGSGIGPIGTGLGAIIGFTIGFSLNFLDFAWDNKLAQKMSNGVQKIQKWITVDLPEKMGGWFDISSIGDSKSFGTEIIDGMLVPSEKSMSNMASSYDIAGQTIGGYKTSIVDTYGEIDTMNISLTTINDALITNGDHITATYIPNLQGLDKQIIQDTNSLVNMKASISALKSKTITITTIYKKVYKTVGEKD